MNDTMSARGGSLPVRQAGAFGGKILTRGLILSVISFFVFNLVPTSAYYGGIPVLSASYQGSGSNNLQISVSNGPSGPINLYYRQSSSLWTTVNNIGQADQNGNFSQVISVPPDGSSSPLQLYVTVNGQQSATVSVYPNGSGGGCGYYGCGGSGSLTLSQNSISLNVGQSVTVNINNSYVYNNNNYYGNSFYIASNSNSYVASATVSGSVLSVSGLASGSTTISVCQSGNQCASLYVTVSGGIGGNSGNVWFNPASPSLYVGQSLAVSINSGTSYLSSGAYNYNNSYYYVSSNSNSSVATASVSGTTLNLYGNQAGSTSIVVCLNSLNFCGTLYVTVNGGSGLGNLSLSQTNLSLTLGQNANVTVYSNSGYVGSPYVSSNSNSGVASASLSGNNLFVTALSSGSTVISVCQNSSTTCASLSVTVNGSVLGASTYAVSITDDLFTPRVTTIPVGSSVLWTNSGSMVHTVTADDNSFNSGSMAPGSTFSKTFSTQGTFNYHCIYHGGVGGVGMSGVIIVTGGASGGNLSLSQSSLNVAIGQTSTVSAYNNGGSGLYISSNSNASVASASASGNQILVYGLTAGSTTLNICASSGYGCATLYVIVGGNNNCTYYNCGNMSLSQTSLSLSPGQTSNVIIYGGGSYFVSSNSNPLVASANISGNLLTVYANQNQSGTTGLYICANNTSQCATLYVTVSGYASNYGSNNVVLNPSGLNMTVGQTSTVNASGSVGYGYYLASNSNPGVVTASFNGSVLTVYALQAGNATLQVCQNSATYCATLAATVAGVPSYSPVGTPIGPSGGNGSVLGASIYPNGTLISELGTVYIVYKNLKTGFASAGVFTSLGFKFSNVASVISSGLADSGYVVNTAAASHPWGTWIKSGQTVYFVHQSGLIPVPDWNTFLNNGGQANLIVNANIYDVRLPMLSPMVSADSRLLQ